MGTSERVDEKSERRLVESIIKIVVAMVEIRVIAVYSLVLGDWIAATALARIIRKKVWPLPISNWASTNIIYILI